MGDDGTKKTPQKALKGPANLKSADFTSYDFTPKVLTMDEYSELLTEKPWLAFRDEQRILGAMCAVGTPEDPWAFMRDPFTFASEGDPPTPLYGVDRYPEQLAKFLQTQLEAGDRKRRDTDLTKVIYTIGPTSSGKSSFATLLHKAHKAYTSESPVYTVAINVDGLQGRLKGVDNERQGKMHFLMPIFPIQPRSLLEYKDQAEFVEKLNGILKGQDAPHWWLLDAMNRSEPVTTYVRGLLGNDKEFMERLVVVELPYQNIHVNKPVFAHEGSFNQQDITGGKMNKERQGRTAGQDSALTLDFGLAGSHHTEPDRVADPKELGQAYGEYAAGFSLFFDEGLKSHGPAMNSMLSILASRVVSVPGKGSCSVPGVIMVASTPQETADLFKDPNTGAQMQNRGLLIMTGGPLNYKQTSTWLDRELKNDDTHIPPALFDALGEAMVAYSLASPQNVMIEGKTYQVGGDVPAQRFQKARIYAKEYPPDMADRGDQIRDKLMTDATSGKHWTEIKEGMSIIPPRITSLLRTSVRTAVERAEVECIAELTPEELEIAISGPLTSMVGSTEYPKALADVKYAINEELPRLYVEAVQQALVDDKKIRDSAHTYVKTVLNKKEKDPWMVEMEKEWGINSPQYWQGALMATRDRLKEDETHNYNPTELLDAVVDIAMKDKPFVSGVRRYLSKKETVTGKMATESAISQLMDVGYCEHCAEAAILQYNKTRGTRK